MTQGEVRTALSRWTFGMATPWDGDQVAKGRQLAMLEARFDAWVNQVQREQLEYQLRTIGCGLGPSSVIC